MKRLAIFLFATVVSSSLMSGELEKLSWLSGHWVSADGAVEEVWLSPKESVMIGSFHWLFPNGRHVLEFLIIQEDEDGVTFRFKHYDADFVPWEKLVPNTYRLDSLGEESASFKLTSQSKDVPLKFTYTRKGNNLTFAGEGIEGEEPIVLEFHRK